MLPGLLKTKLYIPATREDLVERLRLKVKLREGVSKKLTVISAPAGFGKTSVLSEFIADSVLPVAWVSLDESDNDPSLFWAYFISALQSLDGSFGVTAINVLKSIQSSSYQPFIVTLINEISDKLPRFCLVLDDYHVISVKTIHDDVSFLIEYLPSNMHLVISGRADPPLPLARLRVENQLVEIRADDLRFTLEETQELFRVLQHPELTINTLGEILDRTEGWIVGLRMASISLEGKKNVSDYVAAFSGSNRYVLDYLTDEVLNLLDTEMKSFLLQTSILGRMNGNLCDEVTGRSDSSNMLERLETSNLFTIPLDDERNWYRYHHLFSDLLRVQLMKEQPQIVPELYHRASVWSQEQGFLSEAFQYALEGNDPEGAAKISETIAVQLVAQNRAITVSQWISKLPEALLIRYPKLCMAGAWAALALREFGLLEKFLGVIATTLEWQKPEELGEEGKSLYAHFLTLKAFVARFQGNFRDSIAMSGEALDYARVEDRVVISTATLNLGISYWNDGELLNGRTYIEQAAGQAVRAGNYFIALTSKSFLAEIEMQLGNLGKASEICEEAIKLGTEWGGGRPLPTTGYALVALSNVLREWNRLEEAGETLEQAIELGETSTETELKVRAYGAMAKQKQAIGDYEEISVYFRRAYAVEPVFAYLKDQISAWEACSWLAQGNLDQASKWAEEHEYLMQPGMHHNFAEEVQFLIFLRIRIAEDKTDGILDLLSSLSERMKEQGRISDVIELMNLTSLVQAQSGNAEDALATLGQAIKLAEPEGYVRIFIEHGMPIEQMLRQAFRKGIAREYTGTLVNAFHPEENQHISVAGLLSKQERSILRLMSSGLSNKEISTELFLSLNTIKWYSSQIYSKLGVSSRAEAVKQAYELNLLQ